jgi:AcrR family transcriptional regulator
MATPESGQTEAPGPGPSAARTARARARAEITSEILDAGRHYLATDGAPGLSLRAIARDLGMASSAVYRYVASRDELLTKLIIEAYDSLGAAAETAEAAVDRADLAGRWAAVCTAVRVWASANPNEYALIYGSPVPGYVAPAETIAPASRAANVLIGILIDADGQRPGAGSDPAEGDKSAWSQALRPLRDALPAGVSASSIQTGLMTWSGLFGVISFELFGQFHNVVAEDSASRDSFFAECVQRWAAQLGLVA